MATIADLGAEASRQHRDFGAGSLIVCDRLVRIYSRGRDRGAGPAGARPARRPRARSSRWSGASGSGKSTLMNILAGLDTPTAGSARVAGNDLLAMTAAAPAALPAAGRRLRLAADLAQPAAVPDRRAERRAADAARRAAGPGDAPAPGRRTARAARRRRLPRPPAGPDVRRRAAAGRDRGRAGQRPARCCSPTSPPASWTRPPRAEVFGALRGATSELGVDRRDRHPRPGGVRGRCAAPSRSATAAPAPRSAGARRTGDDGEHGHRAGVRGAGPGRPAAAAARDDRSPRPARPGTAGSGARPHRRLAGPPGADHQLGGRPRTCWR